MTVPAGLLTVGAGVKADAGITVSLVDSTVRVALGFVSGNKAADLARGVLSSLLLNQLRAAAALVCLALGAGYGAWQAIAAGGDGRGQVRSGPARAGVTASIPAALTDHYGDPLPSGAALRLGTVRFRQLGFIRHIAYSPTSELVVTDSSENYLWVWDADETQKLRQIEPVLNPIGGFAFSPDGKLIALVGLGSVPEGDGTLSQLAFLDVATGRVLHRAELGPRARLLPHLLAFAPDGKTVATLDNDGLLRFWDAASAKLLSQERIRRRGSGPAIAFSPRTQPALLAISDGKVIHIRDTVKNRNVSEITVEGKQPATGLAFSPDGAILAAAINIPGAEVRFWRARDGSPVRALQEREENLAVSGLLFA